MYALFICELLFMQQERFDLQLQWWIYQHETVEQPLQLFHSCYKSSVMCKNPVRKGVKTRGKRLNQKL